MTTPYDPTGASYGYLGGSVADLARFASAMLAGGEAAGGEAAGEQVVSAEAVTRMHTGAAEVNDQTSYGLGWRDTRGDGARLAAPPPATRQ